MFRSGQILVIALAVFVIFLLAIHGFYAADAACTASGNNGCGLLGVESHVWAALALFFRDASAVPSNPPITLAVARYLAPWVVPFVALLATLRVTIANLRHDYRVARAQNKRGHVIVCGLGEIGSQVVESFRDAKGGKLSDVVVVDLDGVTTNALTAERGGAIVIKGDAKNQTVLRVAGVMGARIVVLCAGDDATNVEIALEIKKALLENGRDPDLPLLVLVEMRDEWLFSRLIDHDKQGLGTHGIEIRFFNTYKNTARLLLTALPPPSATAGAAKPIVIVGFGSMGREVAAELLLAGFAPLGQPVRLLVFDRTADAAGARRFGLLFAPISRHAEVTFHECDLTPETPDAWDEVGTMLGQIGAAAVIVCLPQDNVSLYVAGEMRARLDRLGQVHVPVFARLGRHASLGEFVGAIEQLPPHRDRLAAFGAFPTILSVEMLVGDRLDRLARAYHETWREALPPDRKRDPGSWEWDRLAEQFKMSNRREVDHIRIKLAQIGLTLTEQKSAPAELFCFSRDEIEVLAQLSHRRWLIERLMQGWTAGAPGERRDDARRINPTLVDWAELEGDETREFNRAAIRNLPAMLAQVGLFITRAAAPDAAEPIGAAAATADRVRVPEQAA
ncbi:MAG: NAD-binding protein [Alphaproteobacteria bacterium]|nr:NAD-binding protein [Alphaproteobacteria bacterium]